MRQWRKNGVPIDEDDLCELATNDGETFTRTTRRHDHRASSAVLFLLASFPAPRREL